MSTSLDDRPCVGSARLCATTSERNGQTHRDDVPRIVRSGGGVAAGHHSGSPRLANRAFGALPCAAQERLRPFLERVSLSKDQVLVEAGQSPRYAYFPVSGLIAWRALTDDGHEFDVAAVGNEGFVGPAVVLHGEASAAEVRVQLPGAADRITADVVRHEFRRGDEFHEALLSQWQGVLFQILQSAVCVHAHPLPQRISRWLLLARDVLGVDLIGLTHDAIASIVGGSRPKVSVALASLEERHLVLQQHGRLRIVDSRGLSAKSCACRALDVTRRSV